MTHETNLIWASGEGTRIINKISKQGISKHLATRYLLHQHLVLVVPPIGTHVIYCQKIWFQP